MNSESDNNTGKNTNKSSNDGQQQEVRDSGTTKIPTFLEKLKGKKRAENKYQIRLKFACTPRTGTRGEIKRVAGELLTMANKLDDKALLLPWKENGGTVDPGPINQQDLMNPYAYIMEINQYVNKPRYVSLRLGQTVYRMGFRISTNIPSNQFAHKWNSLKQSFRDRREPFHTVTYTPMQQSHEAHLIGIAPGLSEEQDYEVLNEKSGKATGIEGIEVSFQNIHQVGITNEFWKSANAQAEATMAPKNSREYLRTKYKWAPNAIAIYVPRADMVNRARKKMINIYGKDTGGEDPVWPNGTKMRFLPLKNGVI